MDMVSRCGGIDMSLKRQAAVIISLLSLLMLRCGEDPLEITVTSPVDGAQVSGILRIQTRTSSNAALVAFYVDDVCVDTCRAAPFVCCWNTFRHADSASHYLYAIAQDRDGHEVCSDSVRVFVFNADMIFADDFEPYFPDRYPYAGWFEIWAGAGSNHTYVNDEVAHGGVQSFRLRGLGDWPRTDGVEIDLSGIQQLTYELNVMIPSSDSTGSLFGFFALINPTTGMVCNGVLFERDDGLIYAHGAIEDSTGLVWLRDTWYSVRVSLDYAELSMNVWLNDEQIVTDLPAVPSWWTDTFAIATEHGAAGIVYYDDLKIFRRD
jgi:hypothetical protein